MVSGVSSMPDPFSICQGASKQTHAHAPIQRYGLDIALVYGMVAGMCHLVPLRQVQPELDAEQAFGGRDLLLVLDARACAHPLHLAGVNRVGKTHSIAVLDGAFCQIGHGLDAAVGVQRKSCRIGIRVGAVEGVEHEEGVEGGCRLGSEHAYEAHAGAVLGAVSLYDIGSVAEHGGSNLSRSICSGVCCSKHTLAAYMYAAAYHMQRMHMSASDDEETMLKRRPQCYKIMTRGRFRWSFVAALPKAASAL